MKKLVLTLIAAASTCIGTTTSAFAAEKTLIISSWGSPNHGINTLVWPTWGKWVNEATEEESIFELSTIWRRHQHKRI